MKLINQDLGILNNFWLKLLLIALTACTSKQDLPSGKLNTPSNSTLKLVELEGQDQSGIINTTLPLPLKVKLIDITSGVAKEHAILQWNVMVGGGTFESTTSLTNANGESQASYTLGSTEEDHTLRVQLENQPDIYLDFKAHSEKPLPSATLSQLVVRDAKVRADNTTTTLITVTLLDTKARPLVGKMISLVTNRPDSDSIQLKASPSTDSLGKVVFEVKSKSIGLSTFQARDETDDLTLEAKGLIQFEEGSPAVLSILSGQDQFGEPNKALLYPLEVIVHDSTNNPIRGVPLTWAIQSGKGTLSDVQNTTNTDGKATALLTLGPSAGVNKVLVKQNENAILKATFTATAIIGEVSPLLSTVEATPPTLIAGTGNLGVVTVTLINKDSLFVAGKTVALTSSRGSADTITAPDGATTNSQGQVKFHISSTVIGTSTFTAKDTTDGITIAQNPTIQWTAGTPELLSIASGDRQTGTPGAPLAKPLEVSLKDLLGNAAAGVSIQWKVVQGTGTPKDSITTTNASGIASFSLTLGTLRGTTKVKAALASDSTKFVEFTVGTAPSMQITFPKNGANFSTYKPWVLLRGSCEGATTILSSQGSLQFMDCEVRKTWQLEVPLNPGAQTITVTASNDWGTTNDAITITLNSALTDPLTQHAWHLKNTGQKNYAYFAGTSGSDLKIPDPISNTIGGRKIIVAVSDSGLEIAHEDLEDNIFVGSKNYLTQTVAPFLGNPSPTNNPSPGDHGTSVAGLIAASKGNGKGSYGIAPQAYLVGYNYVSSSQTPAITHDALTGDVDIINQSWGIGTGADCNTPESPNNRMTVEPEDSIYRTVTRDGASGLLNFPARPIHYIKAAGNFHSTNYVAATKCSENLPSTMDPGANLPWVTVVASASARNLKSSYSSVGSNLWITGYGGEYGYNINNYPFGHPAMMTTDQTGCTRGYAGADGWNNAPAANRPFFSDFMRMNYPGPLALNPSPDNPNCNYVSTFNGTSSAAPTLSGAVALILSVNPNLSVRDVKHILLKTALVIDPTHSSWVTNKASPTPFKFSTWYGFGLVNIKDATAMAKTYTSTLGVDNWASPITLNNNQSVPIPDNSLSGATSVLEVTTNKTIEQVRIILSANHTYTGDLGFKLTSPNGTTSTLWDARSVFNGTQNIRNLLLLSNAFYGEKSQGTWTLTAWDAAAKNSGTLTAWKLEIYGHE